MALADWFWKHYNNDVTGAGKSPLRNHLLKFKRSRISSRHERFRDTRAGERGLAGIKKIQDVEGIKPDTRFRLMGD